MLQFHQIFYDKEKLEAILQGLAKLHGELINNIKLLEAELNDFSIEYKTIYESVMNSLEGEAKVYEKIIADIESDITNMKAKLEQTNKVTEDFRQRAEEEKNKRQPKLEKPQIVKELSGFFVENFSEAQDIIVSRKEKIKLPVTLN